jgi:hypothetical protein
MGGAKLSIFVGFCTWARGEGLSDRVLNSSGDDRADNSTSLAVEETLFVNEPDLTSALDVKTVGPTGLPRR